MAVRYTQSMDGQMISMEIVPDPPEPSREEIDRRAVEMYGGHHPECGTNDPPPHYPCACGKSAAE